MPQFSNIKKLNFGFTLIETIVGVGIFSIFAFGIYFSYFNILDVITKTRVHSLAVATLEKEVEIVRNLAFTDVGVSGGFPSGVLFATKNVMVEGIPFEINTYVRNFDDPFDGTAGGNPNDTAPGDYKLIEIEVACSVCVSFSPIRFTARSSPKGLESASSSGSLFINVFDANGEPVTNANVSVVNNALNPNININDTTNVNGMLQLVGIPTSTSAYQITVSKSGYSSDKTDTPGDVDNPNPLKPHSTVAESQVTAISFAIDRVGTLNLSAHDQFCVPLSGIDFILSGTKLIGQNPDVLKYSATGTTAAGGAKIMNSLEWDTYFFSNNDIDYDLSGHSSSSIIVLNPNSSESLIWVMDAKNPLALLVTVKDVNGVLLNNANVALSKTGYLKTISTKQRELLSTDWSGGNFSSQSGNVEATNPAGEIKLALISGMYPTSTEWLISNTIDLGTTDTTFYNLSWSPVSQPPPTGLNSLSFQIATNNDNGTWNFIGPDGTAQSFYSSSSIALNSVHNNNRYLRYKVYLHTIDENFTPSLSDILLSFSSACSENGQSFFNGLSSGIYTLTVSKSGYQTLIDTNVSISKSWQEYQAVLNP